MDEIEKLKREGELLLKAAETLVNFTKGMCLPPEIREAADTVSALRPKPKPREVWARYGANGVFISAFATKAGAEMTPMQCSAVHMREVLPAPKWERWEKRGCRVCSGVDDRTIGYADDDKQAGWFITHHNAEMERLTALWEGGADE